MKLFHSPGSCSLGIRILLEQIGAPYETVTVSLKDGQHRQPDYLAINPKGKVPALQRPDGRLLTEYPVISFWLAQAFPDAGLLPEGDAAIRAMEMTEHIVSGLHMRGSTLTMVPQKFTTLPEAQAELRAHGQAVLRAGFDQLAERLQDRDWFFDRMSIVEPALFYLMSWQPRHGVAPPAPLQALYQRMSALPAVQRALI